MGTGQGYRWAGGGRGMGRDPTFQCWHYPWAVEKPNTKQQAAPSHLACLPPSQTHTPRPPKLTQSAPLPLPPPAEDPEGVSVPPTPPTPVKKATKSASKAVAGSSSSGPVAKSAGVSVRGPGRPRSAAAKVDTANPNPSD